MKDAVTQNIRLANIENKFFFFKASHSFNAFANVFKQLYG